ncbi:MAG: septum formation protein Maf [Alphaproteobacteria bacterium]|nr:MAG: septum formation protein Maf [Alphaproteobacteria bacterium]
MTASEIILASQSQVRARLLTNAGVTFRALSPSVDEEELKLSLKAQGASARALADALAEMKALSLSRRFPDALVIGADQVLDCEGCLLDKPASMEGVTEHLEFLSGKTHTLLTACVVARRNEPIWRHLASPKLTMRQLSSEFIDQYKERNGDKLMSSVGAYFLEEEGAQLFDKIEGDFFSILGLPLIELLDLLRRYGSLPL